MNGAWVVRHASALRVAAFALCVALGYGLLSHAPGAPAAPLTLGELTAPYALGTEIAAGYVLRSAGRGEAHDIVLRARRPPAAAGSDSSAGAGGEGQVVEIHLTDRGRLPGFRDTAHYTVAWELPRSSAPHEDCEAVTEALAVAIRRNDTRAGVSADAIRLPHEAPLPPFAQALARGAATPLLALALVLATWALAGLPHGALLASLFLFVLGLGLRAAHLGLPFVLDQDVQRVFTGHLSLTEILTGAGLSDRHPPLYFVVLHVAQLAGQAEAVVRMPAALAGALLGPALVGCAVALGRRVEPAALAGLVVSVGAAFVFRAREVSAIPLFTLLLIAALTSTLRYDQGASRPRLIAVVVSHALLLFTHHTAALAIVAELCVVLAVGAARRPTLRAVGLGCLAGAPALLHAVLTLVRDHGPREAARARPELAWGERGVLFVARALGDLALDALGPVWLLGALVCLVLGVRRRDGALLVPLGMVLCTGAGIALLASLARVQTYYLMTVLPLLPLGVALAVPAARGPRSALVGPCFALAALLTLTPRLAELPPLYQRSDRAFMDHFAHTLGARAERRVAVLVDYDLPLLAYYLAREAAVPVDWDALERGDDGVRLRGTDYVLLPLVRAHGSDAHPDERAVAQLEREGAHGLLVVARHDVGLPRAAAWLRRCEVLEERSEATLFSCSDQAPAPR